MVTALAQPQRWFTLRDVRCWVIVSCILASLSPMVSGSSEIQLLDTRNYELASRTSNDLVSLTHSHAQHKAVEKGPNDPFKEIKPKTNSSPGWTSYNLRGMRHLEESGSDIVSVVDALLDTPIDEWSAEQCLVAFALLVLAFVAVCCFCGICLLPMCCGGGSYGYGYRSYSGGSCFQNLLMGLCCYELCCRGGEDICCPDTNYVGDYQAGYMA